MEVFGETVLSSVSRSVRCADAPKQQHASAAHHTVLDECRWKCLDDTEDYSCLCAPRLQASCRVLHDAAGSGADGWSQQVILNTLHLTRREECMSGPKRSPEKNRFLVCVVLTVKNHQTYNEQLSLWTRCSTYRNKDAAFSRWRRCLKSGPCLSSSDSPRTFAHFAGVTNIRAGTIVRIGASLPFSSASAHHFLSHPALACT